MQCSFYKNENKTLNNSIIIISIIILLFLYILFKSIVAFSGFGKNICVVFVFKQSNVEKI